MSICVHSLVGGNDCVVAIVWPVFFFCMITDEVLGTHLSFSTGYFAIS